MVTSIYTKLSGTPCPDKLWAYKSIPIQPLLPCCHRPLSFSHTSQDPIFRVPRFQGAHFKLSESFIKALFTRFADKKVAHSTLPIGECRTGRGAVLHNNRKWNGLDPMWIWLRVGLRVLFTESTAPPGTVQLGNFDVGRLSTQQQLLPKLRIQTPPSFH